MTGVQTCALPIFAGEVAAAIGTDADSMERALTIALFPYQDYGGKVTYGQGAEPKMDFRL